MIDVLATDFKR